MQEVPINYWAVLVAAIVKFVLGAVWYSPVAFLKPWMAATGVTRESMKAAMPKAIIADAVGALIMAWVLAHAVYFAGAHSIAQGAGVGFFNWLGFIAVTMLPATIYENRPIRLFRINSTYLLIALVIMGAILGAWG